MTVSPRGRPARRKVPVLLVSGVEEAAMLTTMMSLQFGLAEAVAVRHTIDPDRRVLTRVVSDVTGVLEREEIDLEHVCVSCAVREDIVPTLERLGTTGRWDSIVGCLPVAAEAVQVCRVMGWVSRNAPHVKIGATVTALGAATVVDDLLGDDLLVERGLATSQEDRRSVGEVACAMVEYADVVCLSEAVPEEELGLVRALARPRVQIVPDPSLLDAAALAAGVHHHSAAEAWVAHVRRGPLPPLPALSAAAGSGVWRLDLCSGRPFHPARFHDELTALGKGPRRSRGCFWLPTRPDDVCIWDGAGGQVSIGPAGRWGHNPDRLSRIVVTGLDDDHDERVRLEGAFARCLLTDQEMSTCQRFKDESWDGFEAWLGPIKRAA